MELRSIDDVLVLGRRGRGGMIPSAPTSTPLLLLGVFGFAMPALLILQPTFLDDKLEAEWFEGKDGKPQLTAVSMAFFMIWGVGTMLVTTLADRFGRRPAILGCVVASVVLSAACAAAPSFAIFAVCRSLLGAPVGAVGATIYVLCVEWALPQDNAAICGVLSQPFDRIEHKRQQTALRQSKQHPAGASSARRCPFSLLLLVQ